jgi:hypothetical protein
MPRRRNQNLGVLGALAVYPCILRVPFKNEGSPEMAGETPLNDGAILKLAK